jgi:hypothetical protein
MLGSGAGYIIGLVPSDGMRKPADGKRLLRDYFRSIGAREHSAEQVALVLGAISHIAKYGPYGQHDILTDAVLSRFKIVPAVWHIHGTHAMNTSVGEGIVFASLMKIWTTFNASDINLHAIDTYDSESRTEISNDTRNAYNTYHEGRVLSVIALHYVICRAELYGETDRIRQSAAALNDSLLSGNIGLRTWFQAIVDAQKDTGFGMTSVMYPRIRVFANSGRMSPREVIDAYDTLFGPDYVYFLGIRKTTRDVSSPFQ